MALALLIGLGVWQLRRLAWKEALVRTIAERTTAPPAALPPESDWATLRPADYAYRHVALVGTFDHGHEVHVFRPLESAKGPAHGVGDLILTPLRLASGAVVIVNRGFVPADKIDPSTRPRGQVGGLVTITGLIREPETRNPFTPADDPAGRQWFTRDPLAIAAAEHLERAAPFSVDADASDVPGGLPQGGETVLEIPNSHLSYAMTWFGLAAGLAGVSAFYVVQRVRVFRHRREMMARADRSDRDFVIDAAKTEVALNGQIMSRNVLTEGYVRKGGVNGPTSLAQRPPPPAAFRPGASGGGGAPGTGPTPAEIGPPKQPR